MNEKGTSVIRVKSAKVGGINHYPSGSLKFLGGPAGAEEHVASVLFVVGPCCNFFKDQSSLVKLLVLMFAHWAHS